MARLFIVDDHTIVREGLRALLESSGHAIVGQAADPSLAYRGIALLRPDVVVLDLQLDGHSGFELLAELRRLEQPPATVVLTMSLQPRDVAEAQRLGALAYLLKGAPSSELLQAIAKACRGERFVSPAVAGLPQPAEGGSREQALASLSPRERQIIAMVVGGRSSASIGEQLGLSRKTVDTYRSRLMTKLDVADLTALVRLAVRAGLIDGG